LRSQNLDTVRTVGQLVNLVRALHRKAQLNHTG
jgi:hypothetical protein